MKTSRHLNARTLVVAALLALAGTCSFAAASAAAPVASAIDGAPPQALSGAALYQCFVGRAALNQDSVVVLTDKARHVLSVTAYRDQADLPAFAKPMVKAGGDFNPLFNAEKPAIPGLIVHADRKKPATLQVGSLTMHCTPSFDD